MRLVIASSILLSALVSAALAAPVNEVDPHIIYATGGDATPITTDGISIILSDGGGGIFVFENDTGHDLSMLDVNVQFTFPTGMFPNGFTVADTIFVGIPGQQSSFSDALFNNVTCADLGTFSATTACLQMVFGLVPGPLVGAGQNFVLDFDFPLGTVDVQVETGQYTGGTDTGPDRKGDWQPDASAGVTPVIIPEPGTFGALLIGGLGLAIAGRRRFAR